MSDDDYLSDEQLNDLVRQLNEGGVSLPPAEALPLETQGHLDQEDPLRSFLIEMLRAGATDMHLVSGTAPVFRVDGEIVRSSIPAIEQDSLVAILETHSRMLRQRLLREGSVDFSLSIERQGSEEPDHRFRVNVHRERGRIAAAIRALPRTIPSINELGLPAEIERITRLSRGLVLLCGPTGSGKTTTLAAIVAAINRTRPVHIVTIEDPIEYEHASDKALVEQIEVGRDSPSFGAALRAALRQDPDVILVGEMRDLETISIALTAAETGHLILATLHTGDAEQGIHRIVDVFPGDQQGQIRHQLAVSLEAIVVQQLLPRIDRPGRALAAEILFATPPVRVHIRNDNLQNLGNELTLGRRQGMVSLEESLARLVTAGIISRDDAERRSRRVEDLSSRLT